MIKIFFIFEKSKLKKQELNLNFFNTLEQAKIKEWFAYKSMKKTFKHSIQNNAF